MALLRSPLANHHRHLQLCAYQEYDTASLIFLWVGYLFAIAFLPTIVITYNYGKVFLHFKHMLDGGAKADTIKGTAKAFFSYYVVFLVFWRSWRF